MSVKVTILGCGASPGVPLVGCECAVCTSSNPKNKRARCSVLIEKGGKSLLVDVSPDIRLQALANQFKTVDAILITHAHADHCHGLDDVRAFNYHRDAEIPLFSDAHTMGELKQRFPYVFLPRFPDNWCRPALEEHVIEPGSAIKLADDFVLQTFSQDHGNGHSIGIRLDNMAYTIDVNNFPEQSTQYLENLDLWVVDCLRYEPAPTHAHLELTLSWIEKYKPKRAVLTHLHHHFDYDVLATEIPSNSQPAYDGMVLSSS